MYYKTDEHTSNGTGATGCKTYCIFRLKTTDGWKKAPNDLNPPKRTHTDDIYTTAPYTSDDDNPNVFKTRPSKMKLVEQHYKFKIQDILNSRVSNRSNITNDYCPTRYQGNYKLYTHRIYPQTVSCATNHH